MGAKLRCQAVKDYGRLAKAEEDTLSLRVARSGTKLASSHFINWPATMKLLGCELRTGGSSRSSSAFASLPQSFSTSVFGISLLGSLVVLMIFTTLKPYYTTISVSRKSKRIVKLLDNVH